MTSKIHAVRQLKFDAGHRVVNHESKCRSLHGHEYKLHLFAQADALDSLGRVIDFSVLKNIVGTWVDENWDHTMILFEKDPDLEKLKSCDKAKPIFIMKTNPTAENMALYLLNEVCPQLLRGTGVVVNKIRLDETSNCYVEVSNA